MVNSLAGSQTQMRYQWMFGKSFDLMFFFAPVLLGIALFAAEQNPLVQMTPFWAIVAANAFGAGPFHQGATLFAYLDKNNRHHYGSTTKRALIFYLAPFLIMAATICGAIWAPQLNIFIWMVWSVQHLVQQNMGILLLYHRAGQGEAVVPRAVEARAQQVAGTTFMLIFTYRVLLQYGLPALMLPLIGIFALWTGKLTFEYIVSLRRQVTGGAYINVPAQAFWLLSMFCLWPLAFLGQHFEDGYLIPITVHWFQYIAINYVLVRNKYQDAGKESLPFQHPIITFFAFCLLIVLAMGTLIAMKAGGVVLTDLQKAIVTGAILGFGNVHYFLDAFLWKFREPYQRQAILPYLLSGR